MRKLIEKVISKIKGVDYTLDGNLTTNHLLSEVFERACMLIRGCFRRLSFKAAGGKLFIGKRVKIKHGKKLIVGTGTTINDNCFINALCKDGMKVGKNFSLGRNSIIDCTGVVSELGESLNIGDNVGISPNFLMFVRGRVNIGNDVIIGPNVTIVSENHRFCEIDLPIRLQGVTRRGIVISDNCWIGANATIIDGVTIGPNSIVAAGAVVNKDVAANSVVAGVPAKIIKTRE